MEELTGSLSFVSYVTQDCLPRAGHSSQWTRPLTSTINHEYASYVCLQTNLTEQFLNGHSLFQRTLVCVKLTKATGTFCEAFSVPS